LEAIENWIERNFFINGAVCFCFETLQKFLLWKLMEAVNNLVRQPDKTVNTVNGINEIFVQKLDRKRKRSAVSICYHLAASVRCAVK
jgi:hypothetical protein